MRILSSTPNINLTFCVSLKVMHQRRLSVYFALLSISMVLTVANAQGFQVNFQGQKQQGMGCAGSGLIQDASTLFFNPAGASFVSTSQVNIATTPIFGNVMYVDSATKEIYRTENPVGTPLNFYIFIWFTVLKIDVSKDFKISNIDIIPLCAVGHPCS